MVFTLALKDDRVEQCLRSYGSELQTCGPKQEKCESYESCWNFSTQVSEEERNARDRV